MSKEKNKERNINGLLVPAGLLFGLGVGLVMDETAAGMFLGLGVGFLAMFLFTKLEKKK